MSFEVGGALEDSKWQAPAYCFNDQEAATNSDTANDNEDGFRKKQSGLSRSSMVTFSSVKSKPCSY